MACLVFAHAKSIYNRAQKHASEVARNACLTSEDEDSRKITYHETFTKSYELVVNTERQRFKSILEIAAVLHQDYMGVSTKEPAWYLITIRPDCRKVTFNDFYDMIERLMKRKFWLKWTLSFEQKGTTEETMGEGFHVHIVSETTHRSKGEVIRDLLSSFRKWINKEWIKEQCIDVRLAKRPDEIIDKYLINYESEDGHKEKTFETDKLWRDALKLESTYEDQIPRRSLTNKPVTVKDLTIKITKNPLVTFQ